MAGLFIKLDCDFWGHPKIVAAGISAGVLYQQMVMYSMQHTTDGFVPASAIAMFGHPRPSTLLRKLESTGLIERRTAGEPAENRLRTAGEAGENAARTGGEPIENGYMIPGYLERYPSAAQVAELREKRRSAGMQGGRPRSTKPPVSTAPKKAICFQDPFDAPNQEVDVEVDVEPSSSSHGPAARPPAPDDDDLATRLWATAGIARPGPNPGDRLTVDRALARGWAASVLLAKAVRAAESGSPAGYLRAALVDAANTPPPLTSGPRPPERRGLLDDQRQPCATCDGSGMVGGIGADGRPEPVSPCPACHVLGATA